MKDSKSKLLLRGGLISIGVVFFIIMVWSTTNVSMTSAYYQTPTGQVNTISTTCNSIPIIGSIFCPYSTNPSNPTPATISSAITITPNKNQTVTLSSQTSYVSINPSLGQSITISGQNGASVNAVTATGQNITSPTITISSPITVLSNKTVTITTTTTQPITVTPQNGGTVTLSSGALPSTLDLTNCQNGGIPLNGVCPTIVTNITPVCSQSQLSSGYIINGTQCSAPPPICTPSQTLQGYTAKGNVCSPPPTDPVTISPVALLYDNSGNSQTIQGNPLPYNLLSFIAPHNQNVNVDHGKITLSLKFAGKPNISYQVNGTLQVYINGVSLHPQGIAFAVNQVTDSNGNAIANMQLPSGISSMYTLDIAARASQLNLPINTVNFTINNIQIQNLNNKMTFSSAKEQTILSTILDYNPNMIIIQNAQGQPIRTYPTDDTFSIISASRSYTIYVPNCGPRGGCSPFTTYVTSAAPAIGSAYVYSEDCANKVECFIGSVAGFGSGTSGGGIGSAGNPSGCTAYCTVATGGGTETINGISRNDDIRILVNSPNQFTRTLHTDPTQQHDYKLICNDQGCTFS